MENLNPHKSFKGPPNVEGSLRPFYQHAWPDDLPTQCNVCGTEFRTGWNLQIGPNKIGRFLRKAAYWSFLPCLLLGFVLPVLFPGMYDVKWHHRAGSWLFFGIMFAPPLLFAIAALFTPITRHLECKKCGWNRDFPAVKPIPIPPPQD